MLLEYSKGLLGWAEIIEWDLRWEQQWGGDFSVGMLDRRARLGR